MPFDIMQLLTPEFAQRVAGVMDPSALIQMLTMGGAPPGGGTDFMGQAGANPGMAVPTPFGTDAGPYSAMLNPTQKTAGQETIPTKPGAFPGFGGMSAEQLRLLAAANQQPQQRPFAPAVASPTGRGLPQPMMASGTAATPRPMSMAQLIYGR